ncbi:MAG: AEC family transporter [Terrimicrobiaceae bacterium]
MIAQFLFLLQIVAPVFVVMLAGYFMRKISVLTAEADRSLTRVVVVLLAPCLAFDTIVGNEVLANPANWILPPVLGFASVVLGIMAARLGARIFRIPEGTKRRTFVYTTSLQNYGYIPLPLCAALFDRDTMGVLFAFYLGVEIAFWSVALWQLTGHAERGSWWRAVNPPMVAIPVAILLNALSAEKWIPAAVDTTFHLLGACAVPMALLLSGALIADHLNKESLRHSSRTISAATVIRIGVVPILILLFARLVPLDHPLKAVLVLQAAMPAAIFPIVVTKAHDGDVPVALQVVIGTSLIGLITIPLWLGFGMFWVL